MLIRISDLAKQLEKKQYVLLRKYRLHPTDAHILRILISSEMNQLRPKDLLKQVSITSGALTASLNRIEKKGWIYRSLDERDGRQILACLTEAGNAIALEINTLLEQYETDVMGCLDDLEQMHLKRLLNKLIAHLG